MAGGGIGAYLAGRFAVRVGIVLFLLVGVLQVLDVMAKADDVLAAAGNTGADVWRYAFLRAPQLIDRFTPFAAMLAAMLALAELGQSGEVVALRAAGVGAPGIMRPFVLVGAAVAAAHFAFAERIAVPAAASLSAWEARGYQSAARGGESFNRWLGDGDSVLKIAAAERVPGGAVLRGVTLYRFGGGGRLDAVARAARAVCGGGGCRLEAAPVYGADAAAGMAVLLARRLDDVFGAPPAPDELTIPRLVSLRAEALRRGEAVTEVDTVLLHRFAAPLACVFLPLLGAIVGFGLPRRGALLLRLLLGIALGFGFFVLDNLMLSLGRLGAMPAPLAAFAPAGLAILGGVYTLLRVETPA